jgi:hypothetical protein
MNAYKIRHTGPGLSRAYKTDLLIDAMVQFEPEPTMRSVLARSVL